jgi:hypothetical protein
MTHVIIKVNVHDVTIIDPAPELEGTGLVRVGMLLEGCRAEGLDCAGRDPKSLPTWIQKHVRRQASRVSTREVSPAKL